GHYFDFSISAPGHHFANLLRALTVPVADIFKARFACPAAVAISHHSDVFRLGLTFKLRNQTGFISWVQQCGKKFHTCILSCCAAGTNRSRQLGQKLTVSSISMQASVMDWPYFGPS